MPLSRPNQILLPALLALALPALAEARPANTKSAQARPLNLSLPRDLLQASGSRPLDDAVERNLHAPAPSREWQAAPASPPPLPYGAGFEHRHQETGAASPRSASGGGGGTGSRGR